MSTILAAKLAGVFRGGVGGSRDALPARLLLDYDQSEEGQRQYIEAAKAAFKREFAPMIEIIRQALARAENRQ
ncbi:MAG: hypothetical protein KKA28_10540 [Planctomycetes bacterium]|nr:hypothetical protein [Planctomycetota bacterium]MCG2685328.1 hypothetical protein [Planctomycetales bacterium]